MGDEQANVGYGHGEHAEHEAVLTGVIALASLFSNCVEAFGLIHPGQKWEKEESLLLCRLGIQQARLLIWGDVVGVSSPPASVTDRAVPKHPSAAYPDLKEPTFFGPRDPRLDDPETRGTIENALSAIVDRSSSTSRDEMMAKYGLKSPKRFATEHQPALDVNRLEGFRERWELLREVAESYARIETRRNSSLIQASWQIADHHKFDSFIKLTQEKVDFLIGIMDIKERVDRGMRMDIKGLGWHLSADRARIALDVSKLKMIREACRDEYPEYLEATQQALNNIDRERLENVAGYNPYTEKQYAPVLTPSPASLRGRGSISGPSTNGASHDGTMDKHKSHGLLGGLFKFGRKSSDKGRSMSVATPGSEKEVEDPERSFSDVGPIRAGSESSMPEVERIRSKSVGAILETPVNSSEDEAIKARLEKLNIDATSIPDNTTSDTPVMETLISRHDQYHGLGRQGTKNQ